MYCLFILIPYGMDMTEELTRRRHLIEMGYDFAVQPFLLEIIFKEVKRYLSYFIPFVNIASIIELCDGKYERFDKKDIKKMLSRGEIKPVTELLAKDDKDIFKIVYSRKSNMRFEVSDFTEESLIDQAYAIKLMNESDCLNLKESWRDLSIDRRIEFLLKELEALYYEKASEMGVDLDKELEKRESFQENENEQEQLKKKLKNK